MPNNMELRDAIRRFAVARRCVWAASVELAVPVLCVACGARLCVSSPQKGHRGRHDPGTLQTVTAEIVSGAVSSLCLVEGPRRSAAGVGGTRELPTL
mmetsp:Transcript_51064/g.158308  ORF Transcript_51064/g.158308 Transcript_51064/m.158308 type:complete len:97 (-) Transcript_51064:127-417(-)